MAQKGLDINFASDCLQKNCFTWLITGVAGFIGSNLIETLLRLNQRVVGLDNFYSGYQGNLDQVLNNVSPVQAKNFTFYRGDICSLADCSKVMHDVDYVLHHAAVCSVPFSIENPQITNAVNVDGFLNVLEAAHKCKVKKVVYASSCAVYGDTEILPITEQQNAKPLSPYAASKYINELYADTFARCYGLTTVGLRYFNVFGARQNTVGAYAAVIPLWFKALLHEETVYINSDSETTRDFCYIKNVVQANLLAALHNDVNCMNTVYNIAVGKKISLNSSFTTIRSILGITDDIKPNYREFRLGDIRHSLASIDKAKSTLNYMPEYNIENGLLEAADWYSDFFEKRNTY